MDHTLVSTLMIYDTKYNNMWQQAFFCKPTDYFHYIYIQIRVITKLPNSEQSYKGKVKTHKYIDRQNQWTTGKLWKRNDPDLVQPAYGVYISHLIRYSRDHGDDHDFLDKLLLLTRTIPNQGFLVDKLKSSLRMFYVATMNWLTVTEYIYTNQT
jgi:hypothetical protein